MRTSKFFLTLAVSAALIGGCEASQAPQVSTTAPKGEAVGFFSQVKGSAAITIRLLDNRRSTQAFADAADFDAVRFELRNPSKLKAPRVQGVAAAGGTYGSVFAGLPSDDQARYTLSAELVSGVADAGDTNDPAYSDPDRKVGEGISAPFTLEPGTHRTITLVINAIGEIGFGSDDSGFDEADPAFKMLDATARGLVEVSALANPEATDLRYVILDGNGATVSTAVTLPQASWLEPPAKTPLPFTVPNHAGTFRFVLDLLAEGRVLSRRSRPFSAEPWVVLAGSWSTKSVTLNGQPIDFNLQYHIYDPSWEAPASGTTVSVLFTNNVTASAGSPSLSINGTFIVPSGTSLAVEIPVIDGKISAQLELRCNRCR